MTASRDLDALARSERFHGIRQYGDPVLRSAARAIERFDASLDEQVQAMMAIMERAGGAGLAAPQVGVLQRVFVYRPQHDQDPVAVANPVITERNGDPCVELEGCLSIGQATINVEVERDAGVIVSAQDVRGEPLRIVAEGHHARVLQHEIDHLDGVLMLDRAPAEQKRAALRALREGRSYAPAPPDDGAEDAGG